MIKPEKYLGKRALATFIDYTLIYILTILYIYTFGDNNSRGGKVVDGLPALVPVILWLLYFVVMEFVYSATLGHQLVGLKVATLGYKKPDFGQILVRRIADIVEISLCFGFIAFLIVKGNASGERLGDILAKTIVIGKNDTNEMPDFDFDRQ